MADRYGISLAIQSEKGENMKTLITLAISLFAMNVMANNSNFNCSAQAKSDRANEQCSSLIAQFAPSTYSKNCIKDIQQKAKDARTVK